jgi:hypothetical protein
MHRLFQCVLKIGTIVFDNHALSYNFGSIDD